MESIFGLSPQQVIDKIYQTIWKNMIFTLLCVFVYKEMSKPNAYINDALALTHTHELHLFLFFSEFLLALEFHDLKDKPHVKHIVFHSKKKNILLSAFQ